MLKENYLYFFLLLIFTQSYAQTNTSSPNKKIVIPGEEYKANSIHELFFGKHWRDLWTTPIEVEILNLKTFAGGIRPLKKGGGFQTKSLRFINEKGIQYKFRSINKDPSKTLPPELQETLADDIIQDQISSSNPLAALVVVPILNAAGILQAEPTVVLLPDNETLGEFREEFGGILGMIEIHPDELDDNSLSFAGAEKISGTFKLLEKMEEDNDDFIDGVEFLKARLVDIFLGDWDRHTDQWRWARYERDDKNIWFPIPRDRDQAFAKFDGFFPWIAQMAVTQLENFSDSYPEVEDLTWSGRHLDRRILITLDKPLWDHVTDQVVASLTDSVIEYAVSRLPKEMYVKAGKELIRTLKSRRDKLKKASEEYYKNISKYVDIRGTDKDEFVEVNRLDDNHVKVEMFKREKDGTKKDDILFQRIFDCEYTKEIRLILRDGDDYIIIRGEVDSSIPVYAAGDEGKDELIDSSKVNGFLFGFLPIPFAEDQTIFTDKGNKTEFVTGAGTVIRDYDQRIPKNEFERFEPQVQTWGHDWRFKPWFGVNPDDGLFIGGGPVLYEFGFRTDPYVYRMELKAGYATSADKIKIAFNGNFNSIIRNTNLELDISFSGLEVINFYGIGNETMRSEKLEDEDFYKVKQYEFLFNPSIHFPLSKYSNFFGGISLKFSDTDMRIPSLIHQLKPFGTSSIFMGSINSGFSLNTRKHKSQVEDGIYLHAEGSFFPRTNQNKASFSKLKGDFRAYILLPALTYSTLALRIGGEKAWGKFPFFESAFLGSDAGLRGFARNRFAGEASVFANAELRLYLFKFKLLFPFYIGAAILGDIGRVYSGEESSTKWHNGYGGGIWIGFLNTDFIFSFNFVKSIEDHGIYITSGFPF